jgi:hypothetical protein
MNVLKILSNWIEFLKVRNFENYGKWNIGLRVIFSCDHN